MPPRRRDQEDQHDQGNDHAASVPLLDDEESQTAPRDTRFAISEDDAPDPDESDDGGNDVHDPANKYPPRDATSLPPSYRDAVYTRDPWYKSEVALSMQHYGRICLGGVGRGVARYWPTSRFAQAGFFIVGLWLIVLVTGPTFDKTNRLGWGKHGEDFLASIPPPPMNGDGHFLTLADWTTPACRSTVKGVSTYCTRSSHFNLTIPHDARSFRSSDQVFVFIDPQRGHGFSDGRGSVPATVEVRADGQSETAVEADIEARYEKELEPLLQRANVGLMAAGLRDRGIGIYTWPLPPHLQLVSTELYPYPLLSFRIVLHVHPSSRVPTLRIDGSATDVGLFRSLSAEGRVNKTPHSLHRRELERGLEERLPHVRLGHAVGLARAQQREQRRQAAADPAAFPYFGIVKMTVGDGDLLVGGSTRIMGRMWATTTDGKIDIADDSTISAIEMHMEAGPGGISIGKDVKMVAEDIVWIKSGADLSLGAGTVVAGTRVTADVTTPAGKIRSGSDATQWRTNHTMVLNAHGGIDAQLGISPPYRPLLGTGTEQRPWVQVDATSSSGAVRLRFTDHVKNTPLRAQVTSDAGDADVALNREFSGSFHVNSGKTDSVVTPPRDRSDGAGRDRVYSSEDRSGSSSSGKSKGKGNDKDAAAFDKSGEVWWKEHSKGTSHPEGENWGSIAIKAPSGTANLAFDA